MTTQAQLQGLYKFEAVNKETGERRLLADWFPNLITDMGLNRLGSGGVAQYCLVGSGNQTPSSGDTALQTFIASTQTLNASDSNVGGTAPDYYSYNRRTYRFDVGVAAGNISEVGIGWSSTNGNLFSRALIKDGSGNPTTITVLSDEYLDVTWEFRLYAPNADIDGTVTINGVTYATKIRPAQVTQWYGVAGLLLYYGASYNDVNHSTGIYEGVIGAADSLPGGVLVSAVSQYQKGDLAYVNDSLERKGALNLGLNDGNGSGGFRSLVLYTYMGWYQMQFTPALPKDGSKTLHLEFAIAWGRR